MKIFVLLLLSLSAISGISSFEFHDGDLASEQSLLDLYDRWRSQFTVSRTLDDRDRRFHVFRRNVMHVYRTNKMDRPYKLRLNKFADMTNVEFRRTYAGYKVGHHAMFRGTDRGNGSFRYERVGSVPPAVDWRTKGAVTGIKDQGQCGSCWAFSAVAAVESLHQLKTKQLISLSEQELIDCDTDPNEGCNGGFMEYAFEFIKDRGGITTETNYPYLAKDGTCDISKEKKPAVSIDGHETVPANNEDALLKAVANQPVSVAIDAGGYDFQFYSEGVFTGECGTDLDHGVAVVGYGTTVDGTKYWTVKNSWGLDWGEKGYIRMLRGAANKEGICGIAMEASYPIKNDSGTHKDEL